MRAAGPVHPVRLADGHPAWLVVGHAEAKAALNNPRLSKDMHAALARRGEVVAEACPGPRSPGACSPSTRPTNPASTARGAASAAAGRRLEERVRASWRSRSTA